MVCASDFTFGATRLPVTHFYLSAADAVLVAAQRVAWRPPRNLCPPFAGFHYFERVGDSWLFVDAGGAALVGEPFPYGATDRSARCADRHNGCNGWRAYSKDDCYGAHVVRRRAVAARR